MKQYKNKAEKPLVLDENYNFNIDKTPPAAVDIEAKIIGSILIDNFVINDILQIISDKHFYSNRNQLVFKAILKLNEKDEPVDPDTLIEELKRMGKLEEAGDVDYISELISAATTSANAVAHARIVLEKFLLRNLIHISSEIVQKSFDPTVNTFNLIDNAEQKLLEISESISKKKSIALKDEISPFFEELGKRRGTHSLLTGIGTGYTLLDEYTSGFQNSELIIIAGRPSHGKTAFALNIARNAAVIHKKSVAFFSLEMSYRELILRLLSSEAKVDAKKLKTGKTSSDEWKKVANSYHRLKTNIYIDDTSELSVLELRAKARRMKLDYGIDIIFVDYLQLVKGMDNPERRDLEVAYVSRSLKALAKDLDIPVVACAQLNRGIEQRGKEKRPQLADLRESGAIEQDADVVIFVHRPFISKKPDEGSENYESEKTKAEIIIGKQRNGPIGDLDLMFISEYTKFENVSVMPIIEVPPQEETPF